MGCMTRAVLHFASVPTRDVHATGGRDLWADGPLSRYVYVRHPGRLVVEGMGLPCLDGESGKCSSYPCTPNIRRAGVRVGTVMFRMDRELIRLHT